MPLLEVENLQKSFGGVRALDGASFAVEGTELTALIGPNGSGKSTAISVICGFHPADGGRVVFDGQDITNRPPHKVAKAGLMRTFQGARGWKRLTVMENMLVAAPAGGRDAAWRGLLTPGRLRNSEGEDRERARSILDGFDLLRLADARAGTLSGGQARLLDFARIIMARPRMALLDEPLAGINPVMALAIGEALHTLNRLGIGILIVEHNLPFVESACSQVIAMERGHVVGTGTLSELRAKPEFIEAYIGAGGL